MAKITRKQAWAEVTEQSANLAPFSSEVISWARKQIETTMYEDDKNFVTCPHCHGKFHVDSIPNRTHYHSDYVPCPMCGMKSHLHRYNGWYNVKTRNHASAYFSTLDRVGDWQGYRMGWVKEYYYKTKPNHVVWDECVQLWCRAGYPVVWNCQPKSMFWQRYEIPFVNGSLMTPRKAPNIDIYDIPVYPRVKVTKDLRMRGIRGSNFHGVYASQLIPSILTTPEVETLWKAKQYAMLQECHARWTLYNQYPTGLDTSKLDGLYSSMKICIRNQYKPKDWGLWTDMVRMMREIGMDTHNAHYVCPADLTAMHNLVLRRKNHAQEKETLQGLPNKEYEKRIAKYLGIDIHDSKIQISVLPNVWAFKQEGDYLQHCVYKCKYYEKPSSLILSARDMNGKRIETIEVDLGTFKVRQCYGFQDQYTKWHKRILKLMEDNMWQVKECKQGKKRIAC